MKKYSNEKLIKYLQIGITVMSLVIFNFMCKFDYVLGTPDISLDMVWTYQQHYFSLDLN